MVKTRSNWKGLILFALVILLLLAALMSVPRVSMPLLVAFILSMVLRPILPILQKFGLGTNLSIIFIFLGLGIFLIYPIIKFSPTVEDEIDKFQYYAPRIEVFIKEQYNILRTSIKAKLGIGLPQKQIDDLIFYINDAMKSFLLKIPNYLAAFLEWLFLVPLFLFFLLRDGFAIKRNLLKIVPNAIFERTYYLVSQFSKQIGDYIFAKFIEAAIIGLIITLGLFLMDVRFAFILGIVAAVTNIIPYLGPVLGAIPGIIVSFIDYGASPTLGAVIVLYTMANVIDLAFVFPILISKIVNLHPVIVVVSVIVGSQYLGVLGMIVSIPLAASLKLLFREIYRDSYFRVPR